MSNVNGGTGIAVGSLCNVSTNITTMEAAVDTTHKPPASSSVSRTPVSISLYSTSAVFFRGWSCSVEDFSRKLK